MLSVDAGYWRNITLLPQRVEEQHWAHRKIDNFENIPTQISTNVLYRMVDALTTVKTHLAVTSAHAQMQSFHWLRTITLVKVKRRGAVKICVNSRMSGKVMKCQFGVF